MKLLRATFWIYTIALRRSWECVAKNWIVSFAPVAYGLIFFLAVTLVSPLWIILWLLFFFFLLQVSLYILLTPVPEFIYQTRVSNLELIGASYNFTVDNWIEWLVPNFILTLAGYALLKLLFILI